MKNALKKMLPLLLASAMLLSGCTTGTASTNSTSGANSNSTGEVTSTDPAATAKQTLSFAVLDDPDSLDPGFTANTFAGPLFHNAFTGLVKFDTENNLIPGAAESWKISEDGSVYTFKLREGMKWSDGSPVTAADFDFAWKRVLSAEYGSANAHLMYQYIKNGLAAFEGKVEMDEVGLKVIDDTTFEVTLESPCSFFLPLAATWTYMPVCKAVVEANPEWLKNASTYVGNGPFRLTEYKMGDGIYMEKNEHYYDAENVNLDTLTFKIMQDLNTALSAYESGELDGMIKVPAADVPTLRARDDYFSMPSFGNTYWLFNTTSEGLTDPRVRKALSLAIDRTALIEDVLQATYEPALGHVPPGYVQSDGKDFREAGGYYGLTGDANIEEAKRLLAEAGYEDLSTFPKLRLGYYTNDTAKKVAEALQQMYKTNLGIEMEITSAEWGVFYNNVMQLDYDIAAMGDLGTYMHPMAFLSSFYGEVPPLETGWRSAEYNTVIDQALSEIDPAKSDELMHKAEDLFMNDFPLLTLYHGSQSMMMQTYVENWNYTPTGAYVFEYIKILPH